MIGIVIAGGHGMRLRNLIVSIPKAMLPVTGRQSYVEPQVIHPETGEPMPNFAEVFAEMKADLTDAEGVLVFFNAWRSPSEADLLRRLPLVEMIRAPEGVIYRLASQW